MLTKDQLDSKAPVTMTGDEAEGYEQIRHPEVTEDVFPHDFKVGSFLTDAGNP